MGMIYELDEALRKQKPRKPARAKTYGLYICPSCDRFIERHEQSHGNIEIPYCKWCGQRIDWRAIDNDKG